MWKKIFCLAAVVVLLLGLAAPAMAAVDDPYWGLYWVDFSSGACVTGDNTFITTNGTEQRIPSGWTFGGFQYEPFFSDAVAIVHSSTTEGLFGAVDTQGKLLFQIKADYIGSFSEGLAAVKIDGKVGYIDKTGKIVIAPAYEYADDFSGGVAVVVSMDGKQGVIDKTGRFIRPWQNDSIFISEGIIYIGDGVYCDTTGKQIFKTNYKFTYGSGYSDGMNLVRDDNDNEYYLDTAGKVVFKMPNRFFQESYFSEGLVVLASYDDEDTQYYIYNKAGKLVFKPNIEEVFPFSYNSYTAGYRDGLLLVAVKGSDSIYYPGYVDKTGKLVLTLEGVKSGHASSFANGYAIYYKDGYHVLRNPLYAAADAPSAWAKDTVNAAIAAGLVPENLQKNYTKPVSRGSVAQMFINLIEKSSGQTIDAFLAAKGVSIDNSAFTDTTDKAVLAANALGIINGIGNNKFDPNGTFTRAQIAAIINRVARVLGVNTEGYTHTFTDVKGYWVNSELGWPVNAKIIEGIGNNKFDPEGQLTTEQAIAVTYRALQALQK